MARRITIHFCEDCRREGRRTPIPLGQTRCELHQRMHDHEFAPEHEHPAEAGPLWPPARPGPLDPGTPGRLEAWGKGLKVLSCLAGVVLAILGMVLIYAGSDQGDGQVIGTGVALIIAAPAWVIPGFWWAAWHDAAAEALRALSRMAAALDRRGDHPPEPRQ